MTAIGETATRGTGLRTACLAALAAGMVTGAGCVAALATLAPVPPGTVVSQRDRTFSPAAVTVVQGEDVVVVNDDGRNVHHAYVRDGSFGFDSGDQEPGDSSVISFPKAGTFEVLCGIHPRMRLTVTVRERRD